MSKTLILVADGSRARLYFSKSPTEPWEEMEDLIEPKGRMHDGDLVSDHPGSDSAGGGQGRHVLDERTAPTSAVHQAFASELCEDLERRRVAGEFNRLVVVAAPAFLGMLRKCRGTEVAKLVVEELDKDLVVESADAVRGHLATRC